MAPQMMLDGDLGGVLYLLVGVVLRRRKFGA